MKIANITLHAIDNYGSVLQTLATEKIFESLGCEVVTIDYIRETAQLDSISRILKYGGPGFIIKMKQLALHVVSPKNKRHEVLEQFRHKYLHLSELKYLTDDSLYKHCPTADIYCTGSDQTWNVECQGGIPHAYFLDFVPTGKKRISFSASFGIERMPDKFIDPVFKLLSKYQAISVRELSGKKILDNMGLPSTHVLDPTIAVGRDFWLNFAGERIINEDYLFVYQLNTSSGFTDYVCRFAKDKNIKIVYVKARSISEYKNSIYYEAPTPEELLSLFKYSNYVITDSFHATVFSMMFHCNFVDIFPAKFPSRLASILDLTNLQNRHIEDFNKLDYLDEKIDYDKVDSILEIERINTINFVKNAIK